MQGSTKEYKAVERMITSYGGVAGFGEGLASRLWVLITLGYFLFCFFFFDRIYDYLIKLHYVSAEASGADILAVAGMHIIALYGLILLPITLFNFYRNRKIWNRYVGLFWFGPISEYRKILYNIYNEESNKGLFGAPLIFKTLQLGKSQLEKIIKEQEEVKQEALARARAQEEYQKNVLSEMADAHKRVHEENRKCLEC